MCVWCRGWPVYGFMLTSREIEANPDKCQALETMRSTNNLKEVQRLVRGLTSLYRFMPSLADKIKSILWLLKRNMRGSVQRCQANVIPTSRVK